MRYYVSVKFGKDFVELRGEEILVGLTSKPKGGRANRELVRKLSKHFGVSPSQIRVVSGAKSRRKVVEILNIADEGR